jgi:K+-transporting ATPase ATPase C chain
VGKIFAELRVSIVATVCLAVVVCGVYPFLVWALAQAMFPAKANGSMIVCDGDLAGSTLLAQNFTGARYFHPRPSAAGGGYNAAASGGSNLGPLSKALSDIVASRVEEYRTVNHLAPGTPMPPDAVTASASGLDPDISVENALLQAPRIAEARGVAEPAIRRLIVAHVKRRDLWILGEPRVNVLELNVALAGISK